jgi:hypothetical protein
MGNQWESILVALGIIVLFYFIRKYYQSKKLSLISRPVQATPMKYREKERERQMPTRGKRRENAPLNNSSRNSNHIASLIMHPNSLEHAGKEFLENAQRFHGLYESLFLSCNGKVTGVFREQVLRRWEEGIQAAEAQYLSLAWTTIVRKHCGRSYYVNSSSRGNSDIKVENEILQEWLKQLFKWGLRREIHGLMPSSELDQGSLNTPGAECVCWILNGQVLEEGDEHVKSLGH